MTPEGRKVVGRFGQHAAVGRKKVGAGRAPI